MEQQENEMDTSGLMDNTAQIIQTMHGQEHGTGPVGIIAQAHPVIPGKGPSTIGSS